MKIVDLEIDGKISPLKVFPFYQREPYPANYTYSFTLETNSKKKFNSLVKKLNNNRFESFLLSLSLMMDELQDNEAGYLLNSISSYEISENKIKIFGICSTIRRHWKE